MCMRGAVNVCYYNLPGSSGVIIRRVTRQRMMITGRISPWNNHCSFWWIPIRYISWVYIQCVSKTIRLISIQSPCTGQTFTDVVFMSTNHSTIWKFYFKWQWTSGLYNILSLRVVAGLWSRTNDKLYNVV